MKDARTASLMVAVISLFLIGCGQEAPDVEEQASAQATGAYHGELNADGIAMLTELPDLFEVGDIPGQGDVSGHGWTVAGTGKWENAKLTGTWYWQWPDHVQRVEDMQGWPNQSAMDISVEMAASTTD